MSRIDPEVFAALYPEPIKVYVDDLRICPEGWTLARTPSQAIRLLASFMVTEISLDHDIDHPHRDPAEMGRACNDSFEPVAWFIAAMPAHLKPVVRFHTANPDGQRKMESLLASFRWPDASRRGGGA